MRKIEQEMIRAIVSRENWAGANTTVHFENGKAVVMLHGNTIAFEHGFGWNVTMAGWATATTRSRLNALSAIIPGFNGVWQKDFEQYIDIRGEEICISSRDIVPTY